MAEETRHELPFHVTMITGVQYGTAEDGTPLLLDLAYPRETPGMPAAEKMPVILEVHYALGIQIVLDNRPVGDVTMHIIILHWCGYTLPVTE